GNFNGTSWIRILKIISIIFLVFLLSANIGAALTGWNERNYLYKNEQSITTNRTQYFLTFHLGTGTNNATDLYCNNHCLTNFTDSLFVANDNTILNFYIINNSTGEAHINITENGTISRYYGYSGATNLRNANNTFPFGYYNFENTTNGFSGGSTSTTQKYDGSYSLSLAAGSNQKVINSSSFPYSHTQFVYISSTTQQDRIYYQKNASNVLEIGMSYCAAGFWCYSPNGVAWNQLTTATDLTTGWHKVEIIINSNNTWNIFIDNIEKGTGLSFFANAGTANTINYVKDDANAIYIDSLFMRENRSIQESLFTGTTAEIQQPVFINISASGTVQYSNDSEVSTYTTTTDLQKRINVNQNYSGSWRISYDHYSYTSSTSHIGVYKNGVLYGTAHTSDEYPLGWNTISEDFTNITIIKDDIIDVYTWHSGFANSMRVRNFRILFDIDPIPLTLLTPFNGSTTSNPTTLTWKQWNTTNPHTYQVSTDSSFINLIESGKATSTTPLYSTTLSTLDPGEYYWRVKNNTGAYSDYFQFNISEPPTIPGQLNITAFDEITGDRLTTFSAQVINSTSLINKSTTTGWVNYSSSEVSSGEYLIRIVPNSSYASRSVLANSPGNVTLYLPSTSNTIDTIAFYLLDYTNKYPWDSSYLSVIKNSSVMHSAYFDADAKVAVYLIRGESYGVSVTKGNNIQNWGNYISTASGNVEVVIMDIGVNSTLRNPFVYNVTWNSSDIILQWADSYNVMSNINYSIFKGTQKTLVHQLITSVSHGSSDYIVTNTSDVYYVSVSGLTTNGYRNQSYVIDYRAGSSATDGESSDLYTWSYGSVTIPAWVKNAFAVLALMILAGSFGAMHRGEGAIITGLMSLVFWKWSWLSATGAGAGFLGALVFFAVLYHLDTKRKGGGYF
ncbi:MAG: hypothetical protein C3F06_13650, partial [Candidatus Methanoperedenaceae archaeon]